MIRSPIIFVGNGAASAGGSSCSTKADEAGAVRIGVHDAPRQVRALRRVFAVDDVADAPDGHADRGPNGGDVGAARDVRHLRDHRVALAPIVPPMSAP